MDQKRQAPQLPEVTAAQHRARAVRWAIGKTVLGMIFLLGAMAHTMGPQPRSPMSQLWAVSLVILSTVYVGLGLRTFAQARQRGKRLWVVLTLAWGISATVMLRILIKQPELNMSLEPRPATSPPLVAIPERVQRPVVLITGCSSGIGRVTAERFAGAGYQVFASMRRPEAGLELRERAAAKGWALETPALDVTSDTSVELGVRGVLAASGGRIDVLVNNAGYYAYGPVEETSPDELRAQFETNVVGVLRVTRAVLPAMRARGQGRIVNLSSISGLVVVPGAGAYHASKYALEALTEALRYEVHGQGIQVVAVEPGPFRTALHDKQLLAAGSGHPASPYAALMRAYDREARRIRRGDPGAVAETIFRAATRPDPRLRWRLGPTSFSGGILRRLVPDRLYEAVLRWAFRAG